MPSADSDDAYGPPAHVDGAAAAAAALPALDPAAVLAEIAALRGGGGGASSGDAGAAGAGRRGRSSRRGAARWADLALLDRAPLKRLLVEELAAKVGLCFFGRVQ